MESASASQQRTSNAREEVCPDWPLLPTDMVCEALNVDLDPNLPMHLLLYCGTTFHVLQVRVSVLTFHHFPCDSQLIADCWYRLKSATETPV